MSSAAPSAAVDATSISFAAAVSYPTGSDGTPGPAPVVAVAGDFNTDGRPDVVVVDSLGSPRVLLNDGSGGFGAGAPVPGAPMIESLAGPADLNGDGILDLVGTANPLAMIDVTVLLGNGSGGFTVGDTYQAGAQAAQNQAVLADFTGDGTTDIAVLRQGGVTILLGTGAGTFTAGPGTDAGVALSSIAVANANNDPIKDLFLVDVISAQPIPSRVLVLLGTGTGTFTVQPEPGPVGLLPEHVVAADLNGDGIDDATVVNSASVPGDVSVLLSNGTGGFSSAAKHRTCPTSVSAAVADFDADNAPDIAISCVGTSRVSVLRGNGSGGFTEIGRFGVAGFPQTPVAADFTGDGRTDIGTPAGPPWFSLLRNNSA